MAEVFISRILCTLCRRSTCGSRSSGNSSLLATTRPVLTSLLLNLMGFCAYLMTSVISHRYKSGKLNYKTQVIKMGKHSLKKTNNKTKSTVRYKHLFQLFDSSQNFKVLYSKSIQSYHPAFVPEAPNPADVVATCYGFSPMY